MSGPLNLNINLAGVDTSRPVVADGTDTPMTVVEVSVDENRAKTGHNLVVVFATTQPVQSTKGKTINPGYRLTKYYPLQASPKQVESGMGDRPAIDLAMLVDALFGTDMTNRPNLDAEVIRQMTGKTARVILKIRESEEFGEQNEITRVLPL